MFSIIPGARRIYLGPIEYTYCTRYSQPYDMADMACTSCHKVFKKPSTLRRHQNGKRQCAPILAKPVCLATTGAKPDHICRFCNRVFARATTMRHHILTSCKIAPTEKNGNAGMELLYEHTMQNRMAALEAQNTEMMSLIRQMAVTGTAIVPTDMPAIGLEALTNHTGSVTNKAVSNTTQAAGEVGLILCDHANIATDKSVAFNLFGKESLAHANSERIRAILDESLRDTSSIQAAARMAVTKTAMLIYSDPDHPENLTCYMPNKKTNDVLAHTERGWEIIPVSMVINQIGQKTIDHLFAKQPFEDADDYTLIMKELQQNEQAYISDAIVRPILIRNRGLLGQATDVMPKCGMP